MRNPLRFPREAVVAAYQAGDPLRVIAERYGVSKEAIRQALKQQGVPLRRRGGNTGPHSRHRKG